MKAPTNPARAPRPASPGLGCALPFGLVFSVIGFGAFWLLFLSPIIRHVASRDWVETPCEILSSELVVSHGSKNTTYRIEIRYRYTWSGTVHESDRYDFTRGSSNVGVDRKRAVVRAHPPGLRTTCLVDPQDPAQAVISRALTTDLWFGLGTLLFPAFGIGFIYVTWRRAHSHAAQTSPLGSATNPKTAAGNASASLRTTAFTPEPIPAGEVRLRPVTGRTGGFVAALIIALVWNGAVGFFFTLALRDMGGRFGWFPVLFFLPFLAVGLFLAASALQAVSRLFAPPVELRLDPSRLRLGARVPFAWRLGGRGVRKLTLRLIGREETTFRQGNRTTTDKSDFHRALLFESADRLTLTEGRAEIVLPALEAVPSLDAANHKIVWELVVAGEIPWRADLDDRFVLKVNGPAATAPAANAAPEPVAHRVGDLTLWSVDRFAPGETLVFTLARDTTASPDSDGPLSLRLGWFTEGKGGADAEVVWSEIVPDLAPGAEHQAEVVLPTAPWTFSGKLVAVAWRLEVLGAEDRLLVSAPLVLAPGGEAVRLPALPPQPSPFQLRKAAYLGRRATRD